MRSVALAALLLVAVPVPLSHAQACGPNAVPGLNAGDPCITLGAAMGVVAPGQTQTGRGSDLQPMMAAVGVAGAAPGQAPGQPGQPGATGLTAPGVVPQPSLPSPTVSGPYVFDAALSAAYGPINRAPDRAAFARSLPANTTVIADPRTVSIVLHTHGPLSWTDDRILTSTADVAFTALPASAYGPQPPPPPCRGALAYSAGPANTRSGDLAAGVARLPERPALMLTGDGFPDSNDGSCSGVTHTVRAEP